MTKRLNESLIQVLHRLETIYRGKNQFKSRAYKKAAETIMTIGNDITDSDLVIEATKANSAYNTAIKSLQTALSNISFDYGTKN